MLEKYLTNDELEMIKNEKFDSNGLRHSIQELNNISLVDKTIREISDFVDAITFIMVKKQK
jgi:hypothetical protein